MRTMLVNPAAGAFRAYNPRPAPTTMVMVKTSAPRKRRKAKARNASPLLMVSNTTPRRRGPRKRRTYRNAALLSNPMLRANPLVLPNRRRRRRRNPEFTLNAFLTHMGQGALGGGASYVLNKFMIGRIGAQDTSGTMVRTLVRVALGGAAAIMMPGGIGAAFNGAMYYPAFGEFDQWWAQQSADAAADTSTQDIEADLMDVLDGN